MRRDACRRTMARMDTSVSERPEAAPTRERKTIELLPERMRSSERAASPARECQGLCFLGLEQAYESVGGSVSCEEVVQRLRDRSDQPLSILAHWIVDREIILVSRQDRTLIPTFQFAKPHYTRRPDIANVIAELRPVFDDWELATWFVTPNTWLGEALPVKLIDLDPQRVFEAARVDRYVACG